ncbi:hypothetical protein D8M04_03165 [Oceanobacillus piezotolerans]|uniref:YmcC n=1 Tax=Oceanobacillus piezotolerans TaxID=2448030 RepID=A0A498DGG6_9BACI|nr:hypothetical protein [Oceanobacillus piezotolerans]RLL48288.1 hypothetical protein D8M04_03165 [Oceanobacillus piezotolerans]
MNFIAWCIIAAEVGFWVVIILGLISRYILNRKALGIFFLALTPVIDLLLLIIVTVDLLNGGTATMAHSIAAMYLGVSLVFGKSMIRWADQRFLYYIKKEGEKPGKLYGYAYARHSLKGSFQHLIAYIIGAGILYMLILLVNDTERVSVFFDTLKLWSLVVGIDFAISISYFIWPRKMR